MRKRPYILTDLEDRALAACDDMYLEALIARNVLSTWYERVIPFRELRSVYRRLVELGLLRTYAKHHGRLKAVELSGHRTEALSVRATKKGCQYLGRKRHVAN
jgi:hypothetical protein